MGKCEVAMREKCPNMDFFYLDTFYAMGPLNYAVMFSTILASNGRIFCGRKPKKKPTNVHLASH